MRELNCYVVAVLLCMFWGCGSTPPGGDSLSDVEDDQTGRQPDSGADEVDDTDTPSAPDAPTCPSLQNTFGFMIPASYAVVVEYRQGPGAEDTVNFTLGSGFAVGPHTLATNAHVATGVLENAFPIDRVVAVQAGTGRVVELTSATKHPGYDGDPLGSPDVAVFTTQDELPEFLELASSEEVSDLASGDELALTGFPGDVNELFDITPGTTVPQATSLSGSITALRSFDQTAIVTENTVDFVQHQLPTTPGTSGSPLVRCGKVVAVHNAGTVKLILSIDKNGNIITDRQATAANNFGIHVKHLQDLMIRVEGDLLPAEPLPPPDPDFAGSYSCDAFSAATGLITHEFVLTIDEDRFIDGTSSWANATLILTGNVDRFGKVELTDNGVSQGFAPIFYIGYASVQTNGAVGLYFEGEIELGLWNCSQE